MSARSEHRSYTPQEAETLPKVLLLWYAEYSYDDVLIAIFADLPTLVAHHDKLKRMPNEPHAMVSPLGVELTLPVVKEGEQPKRSKRNFFVTEMPIFGFLP